MHAPIDSNYSGLRQSYVLKKHIAAVEEEVDQRGQAELRYTGELQQGDFLVVCGEGFSSETLKVSCAGRNYFVFREDLRFPPLWKQNAS